MVGAAFCFSVMNLIIRWASSELSSLQIVFFRNFFALFFMLPWVIASGPVCFRTRHLKLHGIRSFISLIAMTLWFTSLMYLPLADSVALNFTMPLFVTLGAALVLAEKVGWRRWSATICGFAGTLVILRPGFVELSWFTMLPIVAAIFMASSVLVVKHVSQHDQPGTIVLYMNLFLTPLSLIPALFVWQTPSLDTLILLLVLGLLAALSNLLLARSFASADASAVQPFDYMRLPFVALLGFCFFGEVPSGWIWLGGLIIAGSAIYIAHREAKLVKCL